VNLLFLAHRLPYPPNKGDKIRSFHVLQYLAKRHTVHLGTFVDDPADFEHVARVEELLEGRCKIIGLPGWAARLKMAAALATGAPLSTACFYSTAMQNWVDELVDGGRIDKAVLFGSAMAPYLLDHKTFGAERVILDMVDIDSDKWRQYARTSTGLLRMIYRREAQKLQQLECRAAQSFDATLLVSDFERQSFCAIESVPAERIHTGRNGVDLEHFDPAADLANPFAPGRYPIVMTGRMDYRPNAEGAIWFVDQVLPIVCKTIPNAVFYIVGAEPRPELIARNSPHVVVTGAVADIRPWLRHAALAVAPLHKARGVQNKVLEAMAMGKVVVATTPATRALDFTVGRELLVADTATSFARHICDVYGSHGRPEVAAAARRHVEEHYGWDDNLAIVDALLRTARDASQSMSHAARSHGGAPTPLFSEMHP
jgi:sugar transferase (PEP-CTERM/EpsH1 system associated)